MRKKFGERFQDSLKLFAPISGIFGFVSDVIQPISPFIHVLTVISAVITVVLVVFYFLRHKREIFDRFSQYLSQFAIVTVILTFFWVLGMGSEKGFFAENFEAIADLQAVLVQPGAPTTDVSESSNPNTYYLDIANHHLRSGKLSQEDKIVNGIILYNNGHYDQAVVMFDSVMLQGVNKYDIFYKYYESLYASYKGDEEAIQSKLSSLGVAENPMMQIARIDFLLKGLEYYKALDKLTIDDPALKSFAQNNKANSLFEDLHHYNLYESFALEFWVPTMRKNQELLGKNLINIRDFFFDYQASFKRYQESTIHPIDNHFVWDWQIDDPEKLPYAKMIWNRLIKGEANSAIMRDGEQITGTVVDEEGNPIADVVVSDFDAFPKISSEEIFASTMTDEKGSFTLTSAAGHLLWFRYSSGDRKFKESFKTVQQSDTIEVVLKEIK